MMKQATLHYVSIKNTTYIPNDCLHHQAQHAVQQRYRKYQKSLQNPSRVFIIWVSHSEKKPNKHY